ncbi:MAG: bifunctional protein-serine/threonine kinase/phosphatase [Burkholderiales bacterium]
MTQARLQITSGYASLPGKRERNEDFVGMVLPGEPELSAKGILVAVADGVSGSSNGREASEYTVRGLLSDYYATPDDWDVPIALDRVLNAINRWLLAQSSAHPEQDGMATTLSALSLRRRHYTIAHIGDTRIYLFRQGKLTRLTTDHVWDRPEMRHVLTRAIGLDRQLNLDYIDGELEQGDRFLLVSDGVWQTLSDQTLAHRLQQGVDPNQTARELCDAAIDAGSTDNVSTAILEIAQIPDADLEDFREQIQSLRPPPRLGIGAIIDGYTVLEILHESRVTMLYKVRDEETGNTCVLKTLTPGLADDDIERAGLAHEEWLMRRVVARFFPQHVSVKPERRTYLYFLMTWHDGSTLQQKLDADVHFTIPEVLQQAAKLTRGVGALHRRSILHRDIKPANIHLGGDLELRILDLGVAISGREPQDRAREHAGTPSFIAPEQYTGAKPSTQMDLYAIGVTLYHMLTRRYPYGEIEPFQRPKFGEPVPPTRFRPDIPHWLENLILKAVARDPEHRFETTDELLLAIERGAARPLAAPTAMPLVERDPATLWRAVAAVSVVINILLLYLWVVR